MKAAILKKVNLIEIEEIEEPIPQSDEVLIKVRSVGVCGSDLHYYKYGKIGSFVVEKPLILGHEASGEVIKTGQNVKNLKVGDRVTIEPGVPCRRCEYCKTGRYNLCSDVKFMATPPIDGAFTEYIAFPEDFVYKIPDSMTYDEAALMEPLSVGISAVEKAKIKPGMKVVVLGLGPIGMLVAQAAKAYGADPIVGTDVVQYRLDEAEKIAVNKSFNGKTDNLVNKIVSYIGAEPDVVFESAGNPSTIKLTTELVKRGGKVVLIGMSPDDYININISQVSGKELDILGLFRYANTYPIAIKLVEAGKIDLKSLVSESFTLENTQKALDYAINNQDKSIKVMIHPSRTKLKSLQYITAPGEFLYE